LLAGAGAGFDAAAFLRDIGRAGAQFLIRSTARRTPVPLAHLPDGSYLARLGSATASSRRRSWPGSSRPSSPSPWPTAPPAPSNGG
jgi:hypothetical protein